MRWARSVAVASIRRSTSPSASAESRCTVSLARRTPVRWVRACKRLPFHSQISDLLPVARSMYTGASRAASRARRAPVVNESAYRQRHRRQRVVHRPLSSVLWQARSSYRRSLTPMTAHAPLRVTHFRPTKLQLLQFVTHLIDLARLGPSTADSPCRARNNPSPRSTRHRPVSFVSQVGPRCRPLRARCPTERKTSRLAE